MCKVSIWNLHLTSRQFNCIGCGRGKKNLNYLIDFKKNLEYAMFCNPAFPNNPELPGMGIKAVLSWVIVCVTKIATVSKRSDTNTNNSNLISTNW